MSTLGLGVVLGLFSATGVIAFLTTGNPLAGLMFLSIPTLTGALGMMLGALMARLCAPNREALGSWSGGVIGLCVPLWILQARSYGEFLPITLSVLFGLWFCHWMHWRNGRPDRT
jgi:hypothetical protein